MAYRMVTTRADRSDLASGHVLRSAPGHPAYPVRLAEELFLRAASHLPRRPLHVWDPCCGSGYLLTVVGFLQRPAVAAVLASDVDQDAVGLAASNLGLLSEKGLRDREEELSTLHARFGKPGHAEAGLAAQRLADQLAKGGGSVPVRTGVANAFSVGDLRALLGSTAPDVVLADVPYEQQASWRFTPTGEDPLPALLGALAAVLPGHAVIAVTAQARKVRAGFPALERFRVGNRAAFVGRAESLAGG